MRDYILSFPDEAQAIAALPDFRTQSEVGEQWAGPIIPNATRWITRPVYDEEGEIITPPETVPGWHCIIRASEIPESARPHLVTEPTDIEPIPAGGLIRPSLTVSGAVSIAQARLDQFAQRRGYDGILSLCSYATSSDPQFAAEGALGVQLRDETWRTLYQILAEIERGQRPVPNDFSEIESELPTLEWPA